MRRRAAFLRRLLLLSVLLCFFCLPCASANGYGHVGKTVRIGCVLPPTSTAQGSAVHDYYARCLEEIAKYAAWNYRLVDVSVGNAYRALSRGALDILLPVPETFKRQDLGITYTRLPATWDIMPVYAATTPQNADLLTTLATVSGMPVMQNQSYELTLLRENYLRARREAVTFTAEEVDYIDNVLELRAVVYAERPPYTQTDDNGATVGIYPDILREIGRIAGLKFTFVKAADYIDGVSMLRNGAADVMVDIYTHDGAAADFLFTKSIYAEEYSFIGKKDAKLKDTVLKVDIAGQIPPIHRYIKQNFPGWQLRDVASIQGSFDDVSRGSVSLAAVDSLTLQVRHSLMLFPSLSVNDKYTLTIPRCIAISPNQSPLLQNILNKAIMRFSNDKIEQIVMKHTGETANALSFEYILYYYPLHFGLTVAFILLLTVGLIFFVQYSRDMKLQQMVLAAKNEALVDTLNALADANAEKESYKQRSETDALTGVYNKATIEAFVKRQLKVLLPDTVDALFIIDLDHFKEANDSRGHQYGDMVLVNFAGMLKKIAGDGDAVGRFGGDEFVLYRRRTKKQELPLLAERLRAAARAVDAEQKPPITASIGVAVVPDNGNEYDDLFRAADRALYYVKEHGRDNYRIAAPTKK